MIMVDYIKLMYLLSDDHDSIGLNARFDAAVAVGGPVASRSSEHSRIHAAKKWFTLFTKIF